MRFNKRIIGIVSNQVYDDIMVWMGWTLKKLLTLTKAENYDDGYGIHHKLQNLNWSRMGYKINLEQP